MAKPTEAYAIVDKNGEILVQRIGEVRSSALRGLLRSEWKEMQELGYTCQKVIITVKK